ncbi:MAG: glycosyl hydrolase family 79 C-terminal domain-containing protein [Actinomycetota bacterium]|nr:glycosyl hydrolase family 79 C-terminal domain-containing protein [Actinomycetota bacterium]
MLALAPVADARAARHRSIAVSVSIDQAHPGQAVPPDFLGLSFELSSLRGIAAYANAGNLVALLRSLGPGVLRFGGVTADTRVAWSDEATARPAWAYSVLESEDLRRLASLAAKSGWHILLTIGLGHFEPQAAAREAAAAKAALGGWLQAIEFGNEPNAYAQHGLRTEPWTVVQYDDQLAAYRSAIEAAAPGIALAGPDVSGSGAFESWGLGELVNQRPALLTGHHYPLGCAQRPAPTIARLLSPNIRQMEGSSLERYLSISRASEVPFRLDETNSVSCGGVAGISNTFASALWAVAYVTQAMSMGAAGINLHGHPANCTGYAPICAPTPADLAAGALGAQPVWYALLLARSLIGDRPLSTFTSSPGPANIEVRALLGPGGRLHVVIVDDDPPGSRRVAVTVRVGGGFAGASILSLTAPSPGALVGVKLAGQAVRRDGSWRAPSRLPRAANRNGVITVDIAPSSAAVLTVSPRPG